MNRIKVNQTMMNLPGYPKFTMMNQYHLHRFLHQDSHLGNFSLIFLPNLNFQMGLMHLGIVMSLIQFIEQFVLLFPHQEVNFSLNYYHRHHLVSLLAPQAQ